MLHFGQKSCFVIDNFDKFAVNINGFTKFELQVYIISLRNLQLSVSAFISIINLNIWWSLKLHRIFIVIMVNMQVNFCWFIYQTLTLESFCINKIHHFLFNAAFHLMLAIELILEVMKFFLVSVYHVFNNLYHWVIKSHTPR